MDLYLLLTCLFLLVASRNAAEEVPSAAEAYWRLTLPNTAIPASLKAALDQRVRLERINATSIVLMASIDGRQKYKRYPPPTSAEKTTTETSTQDQKEKFGRMDASNVVLTASIDGRQKYKRYPPPTSDETSKQDQKEKFERMDATNVVLTSSIDGREKYKRYPPPTFTETSRQDEKEKLAENTPAEGPILETGRKGYFLEPELSIEKNRMKMNFKDVSSNKAVFLPRQVAETIPFSTRKTAQILQLFSVSPDSKAAGLMKETLEECEEPPFQGEEKVCATSLESVIDFAVQNLGRKVKAISCGEEEMGDQDYLLMEGVKMIANRTVVCHKERYPYAVHYCHATSRTRLYELPFQGVKDGRKATVLASCHLDTSAWDPNHISFHVLKVKPGTPVCHFFNRGTLIWFPN